LSNVQIVIEHSAFHRNIKALDVELKTRQGASLELRRDALNQ